MFDWTLFLFLVVICLPGILIVIPGTLSTLENIIDSESTPEKKKLSRSTLILLSTAQNMGLVIIAAAAGAILAPRVDLEAPFFQALVSSESVLNALQPQLLPALISGIGGSIVFITAYYTIFRPRLDNQTIKSMESLRMRLGLWSRLLYGGIVEEVLTRWGLMTFFAWLGALIIGTPSNFAIWIAIITSGILFGLGHLPSYLAAGCRKTTLFLTLIITLNLWAAIIFGWLFWQYGLIAAMLAHMLFHIIWLPFDLHYTKKTTGLRVF